MHALMLRSLQGYIRDTFGSAVWISVVRGAALKIETFEPMLRYDPVLVDRVVFEAARVLDRPAEAVWEDMGTYLITNPAHQGVRRLLRFGGVGFADFLHSLEEMPGRARLAWPDLTVPDLTLRELAPDRFQLTCRYHIRGAARVLVGMLTAMADDYGTLCVIEAVATTEGGDLIAIRVLDTAHSEAKSFDLALPDH
jgi:hypothetical protein